MNEPAGPPAENPLASRASGSAISSIDPHAGEVVGSRRPRKLDPKVMDVLVMLAQNAGHVVLREDLLVAPLARSCVVTDDALSRCPL